uniref:Uncharacterized protein n=1 Tax=viral metagenome TaxID=1070528 RepID=A0A6C0BMG2_9ZZZZ
MVDHEYAISNDNQRVQLPTFYPDASHYIYHQPENFQRAYGEGAASVREMQFDGHSPPENLRGTTQTLPLPDPERATRPEPERATSTKREPVSRTPPRLEPAGEETKPASEKQAAPVEKPCVSCSVFWVVLVGILLVIGLWFVFQ